MVAAFVQRLPSDEFLPTASRHGTTETRMSASRQIFRPVFATVSCALFFVLASAMRGQNTALAQRGAFSPQQPQPSHKLNLRFPGEQARPLTMVSGDFDEDGVNDLAVGYGLEEGGSIALFRGNPDAMAPRSSASWLTAGRHEDVEAFRQQSNAVPVKMLPSLMVSADVNGDGHLDLVYA